MITPGNVHDSTPYLDRLERQQKRFGFQVQSVALDLTMPIYHFLRKKFTQRLPVKGIANINLEAVSKLPNMN